MKRKQKVLILLTATIILSSCTVMQPTGMVENDLLGMQNQTYESYTGMFSNTYIQTTSTPLPAGSLMFIDVDEANTIRAEREERKHDPFLFVDIPDPIVVDRTTSTPSTNDATTPSPHITEKPSVEQREKEPSTPIFRLCGAPSTRYAYQQLTPKQKSLFAELYDGIVENRNSIQVKGKYEYSDYIRVYWTLYYDCPELFNVEWYVLCYLYGDSEGEFVEHVELSYCMSNNEYKQRLGKVIDIIEGFSSHDEFGSNDIEHEIYIQCYLIDNVTYLLQEDARRADRAFLDNYAKCDGYSNATMMALRYYGIPCLNITGWTYKDDGTRAETAHQWNMVKINGNWYHLDTTWNDSNGNFPLVLEMAQKKEAFWLPYMNTSDKRMLFRRTVDMENDTWELPKANTESASYFNVVGMSVENTEEARDNLSSQLSNIAANGGEYAVVCLENPSDVDGFVTMLDSFMGEWRGWSNERIRKYFCQYWSDIGLVCVYDIAFQ